MVRGRGLAVASALIVGATTVIYVVAITAQGERQIAKVAFVVLLFLAALVCVIAALVFEDASARAAAGSAAAGSAAAGSAAAGFLLSMGYLAIFSVGLLLIVAGVLMVAWLVRTRPQRRGSRSIVPYGAFAVGALIPWALVLL